jgi:hypothetical protein
VRVSPSTDLRYEPNNSEVLGKSMQSTQRHKTNPGHAVRSTTLSGVAEAGQAMSASCGVCVMSSNEKALSTRILTSLEQLKALSENCDLVIGLRVIG